MHHYIFSLSDLCLKYRRNFKEILHFHPVIYIATPYHKKPCPVGHEIYYFVKPFFGPHYYALSLSHLCRRFSKKCIFTKSLIWSQTPAPGIMKFTILVDPSFVIITIHIVCLNQATEYRGSLINTSILLFLHPNYLPLGRDVMKFTISCLLTLHIKYGLTLAQWFLRRRCKLTMNDGRRTMTDSKP